MPSPKKCDCDFISSPENMAACPCCGAVEGEPCRHGFVSKQEIEKVVKHLGDLAALQNGRTTKTVEEAYLHAQEWVKSLLK